MRERLSNTERLPLSLLKEGPPQRAPEPADYPLRDFDVAIDAIMNL